MSSRFQLGKTNKKSRKKTVLVVALVLLLLLTAGAIYWFMFRSEEPTNVDRNSTDPTIQSDKDKTSEQSDSKTGTDTGTSSVPADQVPVSSDVTIREIEFTQDEGYVIAGAKLRGASQAGKCVFSFTAADSKPVVKEASGAQDCNVRISEVEFDKIGEWDLNVSFYSGDTKATANKKVMIQ